MKELQNLYEAKWRVVLASNHEECLGLTKMIAREKTKSVGGYTPKC